MPVTVSLPPFLSVMNAVDWALVAIVLLGAWGGWRRGFVTGILHLLVLAIAVAAAFLGYGQAAAWLHLRMGRYAEWAVPVAFVLLFAIVYVVAEAVARSLIRATPRPVHLHVINRLLGLVPGAINGLIVATVAAVLLLTMPLFNRLTGLTRDSVLVTRLAEPAEWAESRLEPVFEAPIRRALQPLMVPVESRAFIDLPFKVSDPKDRPDLEAQMLDMLNAERAKRELRPLRPDPELTQVARAHSRDMFERGYFSHSTPDHHDPFDRMRQAHVRFLTAGENLALAPTLDAAEAALMNSSGHRANILRPQFGRVGIGVLDGGRHGLMVTQEFRN
ncbi:MAG TPA: CvpA family protein [Ramlibacter sp.]|nr:CvpA family protein [Ramlibacter sp.]